MDDSEFCKRRPQRSNAASRNNGGKITNSSTCNMHKRPTLKNDQLSDQNATSTTVQFLELLNNNNAALAQSSSTSTSNFCLNITGASSINSDDLMGDISSVGGEDYYNGDDGLVMDEDEDELVNVTGNTDIDPEQIEDSNLTSINHTEKKINKLNVSNASDEVSKQNPLNILSKAAETALTDTTELNVSVKNAEDNDQNNKNDQLAVLSNLTLTDSIVASSQIENEEISSANNNVSIDTKLTNNNDIYLDNVKEPAPNDSFKES